MNVYLIFVAFIKGIFPFLKKYTVEELSVPVYMIIFLLTSLVSWGAVIAYNAQKLDIYGVDINLIVMTCVVSVFTISASVIYLSTISNNDITFVNPIYYPLQLILTFMIGYFFTNETFSQSKLIGGSIIVLGLVVFLYKELFNQKVDQTRYQP